MYNDIIPEDRSHVIVLLVYKNFPNIYITLKSVAIKW